MKIISTLFLLTCAITVVNGQENAWDKEMVGFGCSLNGQPTKTVVKVTDLLKEKKYKAISDLLESESSVEKYLAVVSLEKLSELGRFQLSEKEKALIRRIKTSRKKVSICSGCTYFDKVSLKKMFGEDNFLGSDLWIEETLDEEI